MSLRVLLSMVLAQVHRSRLPLQRPGWRLSALISTICKTTHWSMSKIKINVQSQSTRQTITKTKKSPRSKMAKIWTWTRVKESSKKSWSPGWRSSKNSWNLAMANFIAFSKRSKHKVRIICLRKGAKLRRWKARNLTKQYELRSLSSARTGFKLISGWHRLKWLN